MRDLIYPPPGIKRFSDFVKPISYSGCGRCGLIVINDTGTYGSLVCPQCPERWALYNGVTYDSVARWVMENKGTL
jgi:hypothetical protein